MENILQKKTKNTFIQKIFCAGLKQCSPQAKKSKVKICSDSETAEFEIA